MLRLERRQLRLALLLRVVLSVVRLTPCCRCRLCATTACRPFEYLRGQLLSRGRSRLGLVPGRLHYRHHAGPVARRLVQSRVRLRHHPLHRIGRHRRMRLGGGNALLGFEEGGGRVRLGLDGGSRLLRERMRLVPRRLELHGQRIASLLRKLHARLARHEPLLEVGTRVVRRREHGGGDHGVRILLLSERAQRRRLILGDRGRVAQPTLAEDLKSHTAFESPAAPQQGTELVARRPHLMARDLVGNHQHSCRLIGQIYVWRRLANGTQMDD